MLYVVVIVHTEAVALHKMLEVVVAAFFEDLVLAFFFGWEGGGGAGGILRGHADSKRISIDLEGEFHEVHRFVMKLGKLEKSGKESVEE